MARPLRLEYPGASWHVTSRGNRRQDIYLDDDDRRAFIGRLAEAVAWTRWRVHAWVLMTNHYHLIVETPEPNLARGMQRLNGSYARAFNRRHGKVGHLLQGRYKSILVEREAHLLQLTRYVVLNPVRAGMVLEVREHEWSSYAETAGLRPPSSWLEIDWTLSHFGSRRGCASRRFRDFVRSGCCVRYSPWEETRGGIYLGGASFRAGIEKRLERREADPEIPQHQQRLRPRPPLEQLLAAVALEFSTTPAEIRGRWRGPSRKAFALLARRLTGARLREAAELLGINRWSASHVATSGSELERNDAGFRHRVERISAKLAKSKL